MSNPMSQVRLAMWTLFDAHAALSAFIDDNEGTRYRLQASENLPVRIGADDCPALLVEPVRCEIDWETSSARVILYRVEAAGFVKTPLIDEVEEFAHMAYEALVEGLPDFGVPQVEAVEFAGPSFRRHTERHASFGAFRLGVTARIYSGT